MPLLRIESEWLEPLTKRQHVVDLHGARRLKRVKFSPGACRVFNFEIPGEAPGQALRRLQTFLNLEPRAETSVDYDASLNGAWVVLTFSNDPDERALASAVEFEVE